MPDRAVACEPMDVDRQDAARSTPVDHESLAVLRQVVADLDYSLDALQAAMRKDRSFIHKVLAGDKPMPPDFIDALPDDIEAAWHGRMFERRSRGGLAIAPASDDNAVQHFVGGLLTLLRPQLPSRAASMAKAALPLAAERQAR